jgi:peptidoglycan/xylan/chitin deacetylase (PgdA/CDA1 family)
LDEFFDFLRFKRELPPKSVVITIDDGWCSLYEIAFPVLKQYGYSVTLFLYTDLIHNNTCLTWDQVREMQHSGFTVGNHSKTHRDLSGPNAEESFGQYFAAVQLEVNEAERLIKKHLGITPKYFAYPYGASNELLIAFLQKKGYRGGFKVSPGGNPFYTDRFQIKRSVIYGDYDISRFAEKLKTFTKQKLQ